MTNPRTVDQPDVAHPTNPVGGNQHVEKERSKLARPLGTDTDRLPEGGADVATIRMPQAAQLDLPDVGLPDDAQTARTGKSGKDDHAPAADPGNPQRSGGMEQPDAARLQGPRSGR